MVFETDEFVYIPHLPNVGYVVGYIFDSKAPTKVAVRLKGDASNDVYVFDPSQLVSKNSNLRHYHDMMDDIYQQYGDEVGRLVRIRDIKLEDARAKFEQVEIILQDG